MSTPPNLSGALTCARYAFAPNLYSYCGPDTKGDIGGYLNAALADNGLVAHLAKFETLYPYLVSIAHANGLADPFDPRVVEAYWIGSSLLEKVRQQDVYVTLTDSLRLPKRLPKKELNSLLPKINEHARLHHSFHVFNVFTRTGHATLKHTVDTMDQCRIGWGSLKKVITLQSHLLLATQKLVYQAGKLVLVPADREVVVTNTPLARLLKVGDRVSFHWGFVCDRLSMPQVQQLEHYTRYHLRLANETL